MLESVQAQAPHCGRVCVASCHGTVQVVEVFLDSAPWQDAMDMVACRDWRPGEQHQAIRHFFLALPAGQSCSGQSRAALLSGPAQAWGVQTRLRRDGA